MTRQTDKQGSELFSHRIKTLVFRISRRLGEWFNSKQADSSLYCKDEELHSGIYDDNFIKLFILSSLDRETILGTRQECILDGMPSQNRTTVLPHSRKQLGAKICIPNSFQVKMDDIPLSYTSSNIKMELCDIQLKCCFSATWQSKRDKRKKEVWNLTNEHKCYKKNWIWIQKLFWHIKVFITFRKSVQTAELKYFLSEVIKK